MLTSLRQMRRTVLDRIAGRKSWRWAKRGLYLLLFVAVFANFLANDKPYLCKYQGEWYTPLFREVAVNWGLASWPADQIKRRWSEEKLDFALFPPVPYTPDRIDMYNNRYTSPLAEQKVRNVQFRHWLGTDELGRDTLAGMIWGTRVALLIGVLAMMVSLVIGLFMGSVAGFFGDAEQRVSGPVLVLGLLGFLSGTYIGLIVRQPLLELGQATRYWCVGLLWILAGTLLLARLGRYWKTKPGAKTWALPIDSMVLRVIETLNAIPALLLLLAIVALVPKQSLLSVILILGLLRWTAIARFVRGEMMRIRRMEYLQAARVTGVTPWRQLWRHALPNALGPVYVALAFGIAGGILIETGLSFLGIGMPEDVASWGKLLRNARQAPKAWWLAVFPGLAIFFTVTVFNVLGEAIAERHP